MKSPKTQWRWLITRLTYLLVAALLFTCLLSLILRHAAGVDDSEPKWSAPSVMALKRVSPVDTAQHEPNMLNNLDCVLTDYRLTAGGDMRTGCFTATAFGLLDSDSETVIFNGTDEGLPLLPYWPSQVLVPWPNALDMVVLDSAATGGSYISLYKNPLAVLKDQRNPLLRLTAKQLTAGPDLHLTDPSGKQLVVNPQTLAFSDGGSWLVLENLNGSFARINLATLDMTAFAPSYAMQGSPALFKSQVAVSGDGRYVAIANDAAAALKVYDLATCDGIAVSLQPQHCAAYDYSSFARQKIGGLQGVRHLRFINDGLLSFEARTADPASGGVYELAPRDKIGALIDYLGLGDSYTSGEGAFDYLTGTDTADNMCHLSVNSYPLLLTRALFGNGGHSAACSGAVINDVGDMSKEYRGQVRTGTSWEQLRQSQGALLNSIMANYLPGYVAQQRFVKQYQPAITTVSIGGNDIGFGDILQQCVEPHISLRPNGNDCFNTYEDRQELTDLIDRTVPRWTGLFKQLKAAAPDGRLYVIGYPRIAVSNGNCARNVHMSQSELEFAGELVDDLNDHIGQAAAKAGAAYVDIGEALAGHRLCEAAGYDVAVNGLTAGKDAGFFGIRLLGKESYHPNALGQALMEQAILRQTNNLAGQSSAAPPSDRQKLLNKPKTGRKISHRTPAKHLTKRVVRRGKSTTLKARGSRYGLKARTVYSVKLGGTGPIIGTVTSDDSGDLSADITLPGDAPTGGQTIDVTGENQAGEDIDLTQPIIVPVTDTDADGDGVPDTADSCPGAVNSGQDNDHDGIDDVCDSVISPPLQVGQGGSGGSGGSSIGNPTDVTGGPPASSGDMAGLQSTSTPAEGGPATIVTGFLPKSINSVGQLLPNKALNPSVAAGSAFKLPSQPLAAATGHPGRLTHGPRVINILPWLLLPVLLWLLLLLIFCLNRFMNRRRQNVWV